MIKRLSIGEKVYSMISWRNLWILRIYGIYFNMFVKYLKFNEP